MGLHQALHLPGLARARRCTNQQTARAPGSALKFIVLVVVLVLSSNSNSSSNTRNDTDSNSNSNSTTVSSSFQSILLCVLGSLSVDRQFEVAGD